MAQYILQGKLKDKSEGFALLSQVIGGYSGDNRWCLEFWKREPDTAYGIKLVKEKDWLTRESKLINELLKENIDGIGKWVEDYASSAEWSKRLGWW